MREGLVEHFIIIQIPLGVCFFSLVSSKRMEEGIIDQASDFPCEFMTNLNISFYPLDACHSFPESSPIFDQVYNI